MSVRRLVVVVLGATLVGSLFVGTASSSVEAERKKAAPFQILVTNDDGVGAPGIDALVEGLRGLKSVKVTVIAPDVNKSGSGSNTTPGALVTADATTASGYPAIAVTGFPADTVIYALEQGGAKKTPHLVISGINEGQNLGKLADEVSGTVGAAKAAAQRGVPALGVSQGLLDGGEPDFESGVEAVLDWVAEHRKALTPKKGKKVAVILENLNIPTCATGENRGLFETALDPTTESAIAPQDCGSTLDNPTTDIQAFNNGYVTLTEIAIPTG
ncbi:MAG: 5'/3'-nucleotidase SurE [Acidimicrobiia bacterium]